MNYRNQTLLLLLCLHLLRPCPPSALFFLSVFSICKCMKLAGVGEGETIRHQIAFFKIILLIAKEEEEEASGEGEAGREKDSLIPGSGKQEARVRNISVTIRCH